MGLLLDDKEKEEVKGPPYLTIGDLKRFIAKYNLRDDVPIYIKTSIRGEGEFVSRLVKSITPGYNDGVELD